MNVGTNAGGIEPTLSFAVDSSSLTFAVRFKTNWTGKGPRPSSEAFNSSPVMWGCGAVAAGALTGARAGRKHGDDGDEDDDAR